ncbi:FtsX-like permease family protein [Kitasatospora sp. A2-31]|uniref:FtsX-like permease family protein n=1 Tax=Kitasatospora sp. A2-31 TaxID=2916414 RepID=UPI001EEB0A90|nr:FtsX-like permease family protein [Kitasatospora sp. A2-31]MCG6498385.1 FtsX-like permease family protein [Kitasatospora sp. A2-31]
MYPDLLLPLLGILGIALLTLLLVAARQPVVRRLALRQVARRRTEAALVIGGSVLGTAIIVGALVVGDTLNFSVRQDAYRTLGPVDERIVSTDTGGHDVASRLQPLAADPDVDGVLTAQVTQAAAVNNRGARPVAEPRVLAWQLDLDAAGRFGTVGGDSGLRGPVPPPGQVVLNEPLAHSLRVGAGQVITVYLYGHPVDYTVARVVPQQGLAGTGLGGRVNRNVFLPPGALAAAGGQAASVTMVSNRGGVEGGEKLTDPVTAKIRTALGPDSARAAVDTPKHTVLQQARETGDALGALFLMIGSFSIIAGALLLVNIFVMLAEERKAQLGMLRAVGLKRSRLVGSFSLEGAVYALAGALPGVAIGLGVGWGVAVVAAQIFKSWSVDGSGLDITFAATPTSLLNGAALGLAIALAAIVATSFRISRFNIIAAIRDLPADTGRRTRRRLLIVCTALSVLCALAAVPAIARSQAEQTYLLPALAVALAVPAARRVMPRRAADSLAAGFVLLWTLAASVVRPRVFDSPSMAVYVILGSLAAFSAVVLVSENQQALVRPVRRLMDRPTQQGLAARLAAAYPLAKRFRTGSTLVMYTLITLVLVLLTQISGIMNASVDRAVADATAGYTLRLDYNPQAAGADPLADLGSAAYAGQVSAVTPLLNARGQSTDPGHRTTKPLETAVVGVPDGAVTAITFRDRLPGLPDDPAVWTALATHPEYVVVDNFFGHTGGPAGKYYAPGDTLTLTDPASGRAEQKTIAGVLNSGLAFYPATGSSTTIYPLVEGSASVTGQFGPQARTASALVRTGQGTSPEELAGRLQGSHLSASLVATPIASDVHRLFAANTAFFRLMQGFLALGLGIGITGLGVVMVRAVRERRRTIGVLRALGCQARTVERSFLWESGFVALEGVLLGSLLGVLTTWLMYLKSSAFAGLEGGFPIEWGPIATLAGCTLAASLLAALGPARHAARIRPALAVRIPD